LCFYVIQYFQFIPASLFLHCAVQHGVHIRLEVGVYAFATQRNFLLKVSNVSPAHSSEAYRCKLRREKNGRDSPQRQCGSPKPPLRAHETTKALLEWINGLSSYIYYKNKNKGGERIKNNKRGVIQLVLITELNKHAYITLSKHKHKTAPVRPVTEHLVWQISQKRATL
jgi:hypothetical protein